MVGSYGVVALAWSHLRPISARFSLAATALDVAAITVLVTLSGGAFSQVRLTYFLVPVAVAFRFRPLLTALAGASTVAAYIAQSYAHEAAHEPGADRFILVQAGFLALLALASVLLSAVLERRTARITELAEVRRRLIADSLVAEERQRQALAEALHDSTIQNLLSARHDLEEASEACRHEALGRADAAIAGAVAQLREAIFELHPYVLEQAGLVPALRSVAGRAARQGGFMLRLELADGPRYPHQALLLSGARELLANVVRHARAENVSVRLFEWGREAMLEIADDGIGFDRACLPAKLADGHIGLHSQLERIESVGGSLEIRSAPGEGTSVQIRVPRAAANGRLRA